MELTELSDLVGISVQNLFVLKTGKARVASQPQEQERRQRQIQRPHPGWSRPPLTPAAFPRFPLRNLPWPCAVSGFGDPLRTEVAARLRDW